MSIIRIYTYLGSSISCNQCLHAFLISIGTDFEPVATAAPSFKTSGYMVQYMYVQVLIAK